ncbi:hypothetical protein K402DRAFT_396400 [Aulographum hederae CBS 113979]|uniref:Uncharacterized protein n=1 Tax=Aulographum hederae CBS 113979 TaxID=1176131 RepID=A0A6G1GS63_9PEZI|nr:hypothetical protein K402DRAFT_396400 [Aulographum hederae CBS 113979]
MPADDPPKPENPNPDPSNDTSSGSHNTSSGGLSGWAIFLIILLVLVALSALSWFLYLRLRRTRSQSVPSYPSPAPAGPLGWIQRQWSAVRNRRFASGAGYESTGTGLSGGVGGGRSGRGQRGQGLDPDEAWDARVGVEADIYGDAATRGGGGTGYYEEQELGLHAPTSYAGGFGGVEGGYDEERGRSRSRHREVDERYDEEMGRVGGGSAAAARSNPFGDQAEPSDMSLRGVSPRPYEGADRTAGAASELSPTERKSMFRENV